MRKLDFSKCLRDVALVKRHAEIVIQIIDGYIEVHRNPDSYLKSLVVIGPYEGGDFFLPEAVLLEVGLKRGKPYRKGESPKHSWVNGIPINLPERYDCFKLTEEQYRFVAPTLFFEMTEYAVRRILSQEHGFDDPRVIKTWVGLHKDKLSGLTTEYKYYTVRPSVRFAISRGDLFLASDVLWAELFGRENIQTDLKKTLKYIHDCLGRYMKKDRKNWPKDWMTRKYFAAGMTALLRLPKYLQVFFWKQQFGLSYYFHYEIMEKIGYQGHDPWEETLRNQVLSNPERRVGDCSVRIVRIDDRYISFDFFPRPVDKSEDYDEIPF